MRRRQRGRRGNSAASPMRSSTQAWAPFKRGRGWRRDGWVIYGQVGISAAGIPPGEKSFPSKKIASWRQLRRGVDSGENIPPAYPAEVPVLEIIDIHPHAISHDQIRYPFAPVGGKMSVWAKERPVDGDELAASMDKAGIRRAVIVHASTAYGYDNSYVADVVAAHKDRFCYV